MDSIPPDSLPPRVASIPPSGPEGQEQPSGKAPPKRPWYLVGALLFAWIFGAAAFVDGCNNAMALHQGHIDLADKFSATADDTVRAAEILAGEQYLDVWFAAHNRLFPLNVAAFLLGAALVWAAARAMAGRPSARSPVIQIALAQAVLAIVTYVLTPDVRAAQIALILSQVRESAGDPEAVAFITRNYPRIARAVMVGFLVARTLFAVGIVVALTRKNARAFFEATERRISDS